MKERDRATKEIRRVKVKFEKHIAQNKKNRKLFYKYANSKSKTRVPVQKLMTRDRRITENDKESS